jgi:hypothetical protein
MYEEHTTAIADCTQELRGLLSKFTMESIALEGNFGGRFYRFHFLKSVDATIATRTGQANRLPTNPA